MLGKDIIPISLPVFSLILYQRNYIETGVTQTRIRVKTNLKALKH